LDGHGRRPGTYFQGWTPSSHFLNQYSLDGIRCAQLIFLMKISKIGATGCHVLRPKYTMVNGKWLPDFVERLKASA